MACKNCERLQNELTDIKRQKETLEMEVMKMKRDIEEKQTRFDNIVELFDQNKTRLEKENRILREKVEQELDGNKTISELKYEKSKKKVEIEKLKKDNEELMSRIDNELNDIEHYMEKDELLKIKQKTINEQQQKIATLEKQIEKIYDKLKNRVEQHKEQNKIKRLNEEKINELVKDRKIRKLKLKKGAGKLFLKQKKEINNGGENLNNSKSTLENSEEVILFNQI